MSTLSSATVTDVNLVLKERTHMRLRLNMLIFTHNLGNWLIEVTLQTKMSSVYVWMFRLKCLGLKGQQEDWCNLM